MKRIVFTLLILISYQAFSSNPIGWSVNQNFPDPVYLGRTYTITYEFTNNTPWKLVRPLNILRNASPYSEFSFTDNCTGQYLASGSSCSVSVTLMPLIQGQKFLQLSIAGYDDNVVPIQPANTLATGVIETGVVGTPSPGLPGQLVVGTAGTFTFSFTNKGTDPANLGLAVITSCQGCPAPVKTADSCSNTQLAAGAPPCTISGTYTPSSSTSPQSVQTVYISLPYTGEVNSPAQASTSTTVVTSGGGGALTASFVGSNYLPPLMTNNTTYTIQVLFTNTSESQVNLNSAATCGCTTTYQQPCTCVLSPYPATSCNPQDVTSLQPTTACQLTGTVNVPNNAPEGTTYTVEVSQAHNGAGSPTSISTTGYVGPNPPATTRTLVINNNCPFKVWYSLNGASVSGKSCDAQGVGCPTGTSCNTDTGECYWQNYDTGSNELAAATGTATITIQPPNFGSGGILWSGNISASLNCNPSAPTGQCGVAACSNNNGSTSCKAGKGFAPPATQAEITMNISQPDSYDVEVINGFHIPVAMTPSYYINGQTNIPATANNYNCGTPGNFTPGNNFGACNWGNAVPPSTKNGYYFVTSGGAACNINGSSSQCSPQLCGLDSSLNQVCGEFLGFWSADQVCSNSGLSTTVSNYFLCNQPLPNTSTASSPPYFPTGDTLYKLMACHVPTGDVNPLYNSCYLTYSGFTSAQIQSCCGCVDWWNTDQTGGESIASNPNTQSCTQAGQQSPQSDPQWTAYVQGMVQWMKKTCPSVYTYPFDDKTSGFSCTNNLTSGANSTAYTITFCQGNNGLPSGATEGRNNPKKISLNLQ